MSLTSADALACLSKQSSSNTRAMTQTTAQPNRLHLLSLPAEIQQKIYNYIVVEWNLHLLHDGEIRDMNYMMSHEINAVAAPFEIPGQQLASTCRHLHHTIRSLQHKAFAGHLLIGQAVHFDPAPAVQQWLAKIHTIYFVQNTVGSRPPQRTLSKQIPYATKNPSYRSLWKMPNLTKVRYIDINLWSDTESEQPSDRLTPNKTQLLEKRISSLVPHAFEPRKNFTKQWYHLVWGMDDCFEATDDVSKASTTGASAMEIDPRRPVGEEVVYDYMGVHVMKNTCSAHFSDELILWMGKEADHPRTFTCTEEEDCELLVNAPLHYHWMISPPNWSMDGPDGRRCHWPGCKELNCIFLNPSRYAHLL